MNSLFLYLIKVSAGIIILFLLYLLIFRKDTFYLRNRVFLMLTLILPAFIPFIKIPVLSNPVSSVAASPANTFDSIIYSASSGEASISGIVKSFDYNRLLIYIYCIVAGLMLLRVFISLISTFRIIRKGTVYQSKYPKVIISRGQFPPFSFFPYAIIPIEEFERGNYDDILDHEFAHVRQGHSFDLLLSELFIAFLWFNPIVWLIKRSIILNHEYLADQVSLSHNQSIKEYQYRLLNIQSGLRRISFAHNFNSLIKNRIIMINSKPTPGFAMLKNFLILPAVAFAVYAFATPEYHSVAPVVDPLTIYQAPQIVQQEVKGTVKKEDGKKTAVKVESVQKQDPIVVIDGVVSEKSFLKARKDLAYDLGFVKFLSEKEATEKYGEKGASGVYEITTRKKALEMGLRPSFQRLVPEDYPTFQGQRASYFDHWVAENIKYPEEARAKNLEGWVSVNFNVELDGTLSKIVSTIPVDPVLSNAVVKAVQSSPRWDAPKNKDVDEPFTSGVTLKINSDGQISVDPPFVVVEEMPMYPGGDGELLNFIKNNTKYPEEARTLRIAGRVIVRFVVSTDGQAEGISVLKGVHPLLDTEAIRVISELKGFSPGKQGGKNVDVWYMAPVTFSLAEPVQQK